MYDLGSDSIGDPLVGLSRPTDATGDSENEVWSVSSGSGAATRLLVAQNDAPIPTAVSAIDAYGVWLDGSSGEVWLYTGGSMQIAATGANVHIAGGCIP